MAFMHIPNLYRPEAQAILDFKEVFALEKIHGTSSHIAISANGFRIFSGGEKHERFAALFDAAVMEKRLRDMFDGPVVVYGEAYGGKQQGMSATYGKELRFVVFDVKVGDVFLDVADALSACLQLGLEFVHYEFGPAELTWLDKQRDADSVQAVRNGMGMGKLREGIVIRPPFEVRLNNGSRLIAKHKRAEFRERKSIPNVDPAKRELMKKAESIAAEWVVPMRLNHVLDKLDPPASGMQDTPRVIKAMVEDVCREADQLIVDNKAVRKAIGAAAVKLWKARVQEIPHV